MASIYDKALKRKDFSGIVDKQKVGDGDREGDGASVVGRGGEDDGDSSEF